MMHSAPIMRAAATVLSKCCATRVSTVGTPVMSMMATVASLCTMDSSRFSITIWVRSLSSVPISGTATMPSHSLITGVDRSSSSCCWRSITCSRPRWYASTVTRPSLSKTVEESHVSSFSRLASDAKARRNALKIGFFSEKMKVAVSMGENPASARLLDKLDSAARTSSHCWPTRSSS